MRLARAGVLADPEDRAEGHRLGQELGEHGVAVGLRQEVGEDPQR